MYAIRSYYVIIGLIFPTRLPAAPGVTALRCGGMVDVDSGTVRDGMVIIVEDGIIRAVGKDLPSYNFV